MKTTTLFTLILAGLILSGCNSSTRSSNTAAVDSPNSPPPPSIVESSSPTDTGTLPSTSSVYSPTDASSSRASTNPAYPSSGAAPGSTSSAASTPAFVPGTSPSFESPSSIPPLEPRPLDPDTSSTGISPSASSATLGSTSASTSATGATISPGTVSTDTLSGLASGDLSARITEWRLSSSDLQSDLNSGMTIVRTKDNLNTAPTGALDDDIVKTMVKGKLKADNQTANAALEVDAKDSEIMLKGTADSATTLGRAIALALDTQGVTKVSSDVKISASGSEKP